MGPAAEAHFHEPVGAEPFADGLVPGRAAEGQLAAADVHDRKAVRRGGAERDLRRRVGAGAAGHVAARAEALQRLLIDPLLAGPFAPFVFAGNMSSNLIRNVWSYMIIFCGHFPDGTQEFTVEEAQDESRGMWYFRQILGSANLTGGKFFHVLSGNLSHQIEHHLFPDMPARRYAEIAPEVQEICRRYGIPYNSGSLPRQFATVVRKIVKLALPPKKPATTEAREPVAA